MAISAQIYDFIGIKSRPAEPKGGDFRDAMAAAANPTKPPSVPHEEYINLSDCQREIQDRIARVDDADKQISLLFREYRRMEDELQAERTIALSELHELQADLHAETTRLMKHNNVRLPAPRATEEME